MVLFYISLGILLCIAVLLRMSKFTSFSKILCVLITFLGMGCGQDLTAQEQEHHKLDLIPVTEAEFEEIQQKWPHVIGVRPNQLGLKRIKSHHKTQGLEAVTIEAADQENEFITVIGKDDDLLHTFKDFSAVVTLPSSVDNSTLPCFPPVGNQAGGSCASFATTYYQGTHEYGLTNNINNKKSNTYVFSPKWTYNFINHGKDLGSNIFQPYYIFNQNGFASMAQFPIDGNYLEWDLIPGHWRSAINKRSTMGQYITGLGGATQDLQVIKQMLTNGHILTFATMSFYSWVQGKVLADPSTTNNPHAGEVATIWQDGLGQGGHALTIVGYDDTIWIDINGNGVVDAGEKGAFKVVNSWGPGYANDGFIWVAYDAFLSVSAVQGGPSTNRQPVADASRNACVSAVPIAPKYTPQLLAKVSLTQSMRDQIALSIGVSDTNSTTPTRVLPLYALTNAGGDYEFDGTAPGAPQTATFYFDLTDLLPAVAGTVQRYYIVVKDDSVGDPTLVNVFSLIDVAQHKTFVSKNLPVSCDNSQVVLYLDH